MKALCKIVIPTFLILLPLLLTGCTEKPDPRLISAQRDMDLNPDSILCVINSIDTTSFGEYNMATYYLILAQALDKTGKLDENYSSIDKSLEYFMFHGNMSEKMMANFYKGSTTMSRGDYKESMRFAFEAYRQSLETKDPYWIAKTAEFVADIFSFTNTFDERLKYQQIAVENYKKANYLDNYEFALCDLATSLINTGKIEQALALCDSVFQEAIKFKNFEVANYAKSCLIDGYARSYYPQRGIRIIELSNSLPEQTISSYEYTQRASLFLSSNQIDSMWNMLSFAESNCQSPAELLGVLRVKTDFYSKIKDWEKVSMLQDSSISLNNKVVAEMLTQSGVEVQKGYFSKLAKEESNVARMRLTIIILIIIGSMLLLSLLLLYLRQRVRSKDREIESKMNELLSLNIILNNLKKDNESINKEQTQILNKLETLFCNQLSTLGHLANEYFERWETKSARNTILDKLDYEIKEWQKKEKVTELEHAFNLCTDNLIQKLRNQYPDLKEGDITFLIFYWLGFPAKAIALFTGIKLKTVYSKKDRLLKMFLNSNASDKEIFINRTMNR